MRSWNPDSSSDTLTYGYADNNQLTSVTHTNNTFANESFSWDANGNQTGTGFTTRAGNEQTASPGWTYTYDANGNMLTATQTSSGDVWTYTYDFRNLMTSAVEKNGQGTVIAQANFAYDALGNRIGMDENGTQTWTLYDGTDPVMDFTSTGSLATRYLNGPAGDLVDTVLARELSNGTVAWYLADRLGTVRDIVNNSGGIIDHVDYSAFGTTLDESSPSNGDRMTGFAGLERDSVTGLNLATFRMQNPATGRWTSPDPLSFAAGDGNLFVYCFHEPTNLSDPTGEDVRLECTAAAGGWHRRITVDVKGGPPFSIGFGPAPGASPFGGSAPWGPGPGNRPGNGMVQTDTDPPTKTVRTLPTTPEEDILIQKYLQSLVGQTGGYSPSGYNCRTFAERQYELMERWRTNHHKKAKSTH